MNMTNKMRPSINEAMTEIKDIYLNYIDKIKEYYKRAGAIKINDGYDERVVMEIEANKKAAHVNELVSNADSKVNEIINTYNALETEWGTVKGEALTDDAKLLELIDNIDQEQIKIMFDKNKDSNYTMCEVIKTYCKKNNYDIMPIIQSPKDRIDILYSYNKFIRPRFLDCTHEVSRAIGDFNTICDNYITSLCKQIY